MKRLESRWLVPLVSATVTIVALALLGSMVLWVFSGTGRGAPSEWRYVSGTRSDTTSIKSFELWHRDNEAVLLERDGAGNIAEKRCVDSQLSEQWSTGRVVRNLAEPGECFRLATNSLLGLTRTAHSEAFRFAGDTQSGGIVRAVYESKDSFSPVQQITLDAETQLPLEARFQSGELWAWEYLQVVERNEAPPTLAADISDLPTETYTDLTRDQAASSLGLGTVPPELLGLQLQKLFRYEPSGRSSSVYAIWGSIKDPDVSLDVSSQIQLVVTDHASPPGELGFEDLGGIVVVRLGEGESQVLISATDKASLAAAVHILRPDADLPTVLSE